MEYLPFYLKNNFNFNNSNCLSKKEDEKDSKKIVVNSLNIKVYLGKKIGILFKNKKYCQGFMLLFLYKIINTIGQKFSLLICY